MMAAGFLLNSCTAFFQDKIPMDTQTAQGSLADFLTPPVEIKQLGVSKQVAASQGEYQGQIIVTWSAVDYAASYRIERAAVKRNANGTYSLPDETDFRQLIPADYVSDTSYTDVILPDPQSTDEEYDNVYFYRIFANNIKHNYTESEPTDFTKEETSGAGWLFAPPVNVEAEKGKSTTDVKITWNASTTADSYRVYRGVSTDSMERIGTVIGKTEFTNDIKQAEQGIEFYYKVTAVNDLFIESQMSAPALGYALKEGAPVAPSGITVTNGRAESRSVLEVKWDSVSAAEGTTVTYSLYRNSSTDSVYTLIKSGISGDHFTDETVKAGNVYYYYVQTVAEKAGEVIKSPFSETGAESASPAVGFLLSAPSYFEAADGAEDSTILLRWLPSAGASYMAADGNAFTYFIYQSDDANGVYGKINAEAVSGTLDSEGYLCYEVSKYPYYKISAYNPASSDQTESALSSAIAPIPAAPQNVEASKCAYVAERWNPNANNVYPVKITWKKPADDNPSGYYIFRSTKPDSSFKKLNENAVVPVTGLNDEVLYYVDSDPSTKVGAVYYYKVVSVNSLNQGKKSNDPVNDAEHKCMGWGALTREQWFREYNKTIKESQKKLTLMHKGSLDALGEETKSGTISGTIYYKASGGLSGASVIMKYTSYADFYINNDPALGVYFCLNGNSDTEITNVTSQSGSMKKSVVCTGMYPGTAYYDGIQIKGGAAGGGYYEVEIRDQTGSVVLNKAHVDWVIGEE